MNTVAFCVLIVFLLPVTLSQSTVDTFGSSCQVHDNTLREFLQKDLSLIRNEMSQIKKTLSQLENKQTCLPARSCE